MEGASVPSSLGLASISSAQLVPGFIRMLVSPVGRVGGGPEYLGVSMRPGLNIRLYPETRELQSDLTNEMQCGPIPTIPTSTHACRRIPLTHPNTLMKPPRTMTQLCLLYFTSETMYPPRPRALTVQADAPQKMHLSTRRHRTDLSTPWTPHLHPHTLSMFIPVLP